jgi:hypothetical protein
MLSITECKKILNKNGRRYTDEQIRLIAEYLWELAKLELRTHEKIDSHENSGDNESGEQ